MNNRSRGYLYVAGQILLLVLLFTAPRMPEPYGPLSGIFGFLGLAAIVIGLGILVASFLKLGKSLTANPVPKEDGELVITGMYARVRHPIYFGILLIAFGVVLDAGWWPQAIIAAMLYIQLHIKASFEEMLLRQKYPGYASYASKTPRFIPRLSK
jgi:protein-S-isoprenylcysteine O-methyltransferase Ste14